SDTAQRGLEITAAVRTRAWPWPLSVQASRPVLRPMCSHGRQSSVWRVAAGGVTGRCAAVAAVCTVPVRRWRADARRAGPVSALDGRIGRLLQGAQKIPAGLLTASAGLLADPAVFMVVGV